ncbi:MAG: 30S ribosomal protein S8, partial [Syntrophales bacterium]|nr:30S ribosomal protein S8 [Syntrophales bacterium]
MAITDPIADMLTRIRNANRVRFKSVTVGMSKMNYAIAGVLKRAGYIDGFEVKKDKRQHDVLKIYLRYSDAKERVLTD